MRRTIGPDWSAYAPLGIVALGLAAGCIAAWLAGRVGSEAWLPAALAVAFYGCWCWALRRRVLVVTDEGLASASLLRRPGRLSWSEVARSSVTTWSDAPPYRLMVFGQSQVEPLLIVPLKLYRREDIAFLLKLDGLKISRGTA